jgi:hypothetical protein
MFRVTSITAGTCTDAAPCTVGITPPLRMPSWRASQTPQWFGQSGVSAVLNAGVENLRITTTSATPIGMHYCDGCWLSGIQADSTSAARAVMFYDTRGDTLRDSYVFGPTGGVGGDNYDVSLYGPSSDILVENNILAFSRANLISEGGTLLVSAYNYSVRQINSPNSWNYAGGAGNNHDSSAQFWLIEGDDAFAAEFENVHGNCLFCTVFRSRLWGADAQPTTNQSNGIIINGFSRHANLVGNVLGTTGFHTKYEASPTSTGSCNVAIFQLALGGSCAAGANPSSDQRTYDSLFRWGNWDVVTSTNDNGTNDQTGIRFVSGEVPSGLALFAQSVPSDHTLPPSLYLSGTPSYFTFSSTPFPPVGPDVSNGDIANSGGHAYRNPARKCAESLGITYGDTTPKTTFNAGNCYGR